MTTTQKPAPTLTHITAADGTWITVTTRVTSTGTLRVDVYRPDVYKERAFMRGEWIAAAAPALDERCPRCGAALTNEARCGECGHHTGGR